MRGMCQKQIPTLNSIMALYGVGSFYLITGTSCDRLHICLLFAYLP